MKIRQVLGLKKRIKDIGWRNWKNIRHHLLRNDPAQKLKRVIFVAGVQRSGTNMLMRVLDKSIDTRVYRESDPLAFDDYEMRPFTIIREVIGRTNAPFVVIKALCESDRLRALLDRFENSRAIWLIRNYSDVINSQLHLWDDQVEVLRRIVSNRSGLDWQGRGISDSTYSLICELAVSELTRPSASGLFWYWRNMTFFDQRLDSDPRVLPVHYDKLVMDPRSGFRDIFKFLGIPFDEKLAGLVSSRSVGKDARPKLDPRIKSLCDEMQERLSKYGLGATAC